MMSDEKARSRLPPSCEINQNVMGGGRGKRTDNSSDDRLLDLTKSQENHYRYIRERFVLHLFNVRAGYDTINRPSQSPDKSSGRLPAKAFSEPVSTIVLMFRSLPRSPNAQFNSSIKSVLSAFSALGRLSVIRPTPESERARGKDVHVCLRWYETNYCRVW